MSMHLIPNDVTDEQRQEITEALEAWERLGDTPTEDERLALPFDDFPVGTDIFELWAEFEANYNVSVAWLMGNSVHPITGQKLIL